MKPTLVGKKSSSFLLVLLALVIVWGLDMKKNHEEEKSKAELPPEATFTIGGEEIPYTSGRYDWVKKGIGDSIEVNEPPFLIKDMSHTRVSPFDSMEFNFDKKPEKLEIGIWDNAWGNIGEDGVFMSEIPLESYPIPNQNGNFFFVVHAIWEKTEAHYVIPIGIAKEVSYQEYLARDKGIFSLLFIYYEGQNETDFMTNLKKPIVMELTGIGARSVDEARMRFQGLEINVLPYFALFDDEKVVFQTSKKEEMLDFIDKLEVKK